MKVKMLKTTKGSDRDKDGVAQAVKLYVEGKSYDLGDHLAEVFIKIKVAEAFKGKIEEEEKEEKSGEMKLEEGQAEEIKLPEGHDKKKRSKR